MSADQLAEIQRKMQQAADTAALADQARDAADALVILLRDALASTGRPALTSKSAATQRAAHEAWQAARGARELSEALMRAIRAEGAELGATARQLAAELPAEAGQ